MGNEAEILSFPSENNATENDNTDKLKKKPLYKETRRKYYDDNADKLRQYARDYARKNREIINEKARKRNEIKNGGIRKPGRPVKYPPSNNIVPEEPAPITSPKKLGQVVYVDDVIENQSPV